MPIARSGYWSFARIWRFFSKPSVHAIEPRYFVNGDAATGDGVSVLTPLKSTRSSPTTSFYRMKIIFKTKSSKKQNNEANRLNTV